MNIKKDPTEKTKTFLSYIIEEVLDGDRRDIEEVLKKRYENIPEDLKNDLEYIFFDQLKRFNEKLETEDSLIEMYPVLVVSSFDDPDTGAFLVGCMDGETPKFEVVSFSYVGHPGYFYEVERDPFYYSTC